MVSIASRASMTRQSQSGSRMLRAQLTLPQMQGVARRISL
jgi:hypothetical protein